MAEDQSPPSSQYRERTGTRAGETPNRSRDSQSPHRRQLASSETQSRQIQVDATTDDSKPSADIRRDGKNDLRALSWDKGTIIMALRTWLPPDTQAFNVLDSRGLDTHGLDCLAILVRAIYAARMRQSDLQTAGSELQPHEKENPLLRLAWLSFDASFLDIELESLARYKQDLLESLCEIPAHLIKPDAVSFLNLVNSDLMKQTLFAHPNFQLLEAVYSISPGEIAWTRTETRDNEVIRWDCREQNCQLQDCVEKHIRNTQAAVEGTVSIAQTKPPRFVRVFYTPNQETPLLIDNITKFEIQVGQWENGHETRPPAYNASFKCEAYSLVAAVRLESTGRTFIRTFNHRYEMMNRTTPSAVVDNHWRFGDERTEMHYYLLFAALPPFEIPKPQTKTRPWGGL